jgi:hypothetical protein
MTFSSKAQNSYSIIYEADREGKEIKGSLEQLMNHVQNGNPIRVGWVLKFKNPKDDSTIEMQHWADAGFITTLNGHIFAQIKSIYQQGPALTNPPAVFLVNDKANGWVAIIGTTGVMKQKYMRDEEMTKMMKESGMTEKEIEERLKKMETMKVHTKWAVQKVN